MAGVSQKEDEPITQINVTPLVDVCLVLVIIFMAVAPMAVTLGIKVLETRRSNAEGKASVDENVNIRITTDGAIKTGRCHSRPEILVDGRIRLHERWQWSEGGTESGQSVVEEVP